VKLWDVTGGKELRSFGPLPAPASALAVSRDGSLVAAAAGKLARVWSAEGKEVGTLEHPADVAALAFSGDWARLLTGATDNLARVWELASGRMLESFGHGAAVLGVAHHPTTPAVATAGADRTALIRPVSLARFAAVGPVHALTLTPDGSQVLTAGDDKLVKAWGTADGKESRFYAGADGPVRAVAVSRNGQFVAAAAGRTVRVYPAADTLPLGEFVAPGVVRSLAFHPTAGLLATAGADGAVTVWTVAAQPGQALPPEFGKPLQTFAHGSPVAAVAFAPDGGTLYSGGQDRTVKAWKLAPEAPLKSFAHPNLVDAVAYSPDGTLLATACHDGLLRVWDVAKGQAVKQIAAHSQPQPEVVYCVAWSPDGKRLATGSLDRTVKVWEAAAGTLVFTGKPYTEKAFEKGHREGVFCVAFTRDGLHLVTGSSDRTLKLWPLSGGDPRDLENPTLTGPAASHPGWVHGLHVLGDGKRLVSVGTAPRNHGYLAVWSLPDGKLLGGFDLPFGPVFSVAATADGSRLVIGCGPQTRQAPGAEAFILTAPQ
jgi:WD40 repeat protein